MWPKYFDVSFVAYPCYRNTRECPKVVIRGQEVDFGRQQQPMSTSHRTFKTAPLTGEKSKHISFRFTFSLRRRQAERGADPATNQHSKNRGALRRRRPRPARTSPARPSAGAGTGTGTARSRPSGDGSLPVRAPNRQQHAWVRFVPNLPQNQSCCRRHFVTFLPNRHIALLPYTFQNGLLHALAQATAFAAVFAEVGARAPAPAPAATPRRGARRRPAPDAAGTSHHPRLTPSPSPPARAALRALPAGAAPLSPTAARAPPARPDPARPRSGRPRAYSCARSRGLGCTVRLGSARPGPAALGGHAALFSRAAGEAPAVS